MDYVKPADLASAMVNAGRSKLALPPLDLLIRGGLAGGILGAATSLAITGAVQSNLPLVGALIFPVGLILIVLLGLDLVTGSFGLLPLPWLENDADAKTMLANWGWVFLGNLIGSVVYGGLLAIALTNFGVTAPAGVAAKIVAIAESKTIGYEVLGLAGMVTVFVKAILCNWMVCLAVVAAMTTSSTIGKIACAYMPVFIFFAQGFEHSVVNMFIIPTGMMRQSHRGAMVAVESNSCHARQSGRRLCVHGARALPDPQAPRCRASAPDRADAGARRMSEVDLKPVTSAPTGDFEPEQKRYLEGFVAGLHIAKAAKGLSGTNAAPSVAAAPEPTGPDAAALKAQDRVLASGGKLSDRRSSSASSIRSTPTSA
jgi:formate/nitrite transporter FocA (FNT family)